MLRDYLQPTLPTMAIGLLSVASGGDTFTGLHAQFDGLPNGLLVALCLAAAIRISFFLFADGIMRKDAAWWARGLCVLGIGLAASVSAASGVLPGSSLSPVERATLDALILGMVGLRNAELVRAPFDGGGAGSRAPPGGEPSTAHALELIELLDRNVVEEYGGLFLYVPRPEVPDQPRLQPWILLLQARNVIKNDPWVVYLDGIRTKVRTNYQHLFAHAPARVYIYRLDKKALTDLMASL